MKGRLFVVDTKFIENIDSIMEAQIIVPKPNSRLWYKTLTDIMADAMQIQIGDYVFFWETKGDNSDSNIHGVYRAISNPYFEGNFIKIKIEKAYSFKKPISEYDILNDPYNKIDLWNIVGKKIAGKSRGCTPLSTYEIEFLIQKLANLNPEFTYIPFSGSTIKVKNELLINLSNTSENPIISSLDELNLTKVSFVDKYGNVRYEKFFELLFNYIIREKNSKILSEFNINLNNIVWYANYLPYSIERKEIDYLIMEASDYHNIDKINVLEFQRGVVDLDHINRCLLYSKWINFKLAKGANLARPIIICENFVKLKPSTLKTIELLEKQYGTKPLEIYSMSFKKDTIKITRKR